MTGHGTPVMALEQGDQIHLQPHEVFQGTEFIHYVDCCEADVLVDCLITVEGVVVICWHAAPGAPCPKVCGATVYDASDQIVRQVVAA